MQSLLDNFAWWRTRPTIRVYRSDTTSQTVANTTNDILEFNDTSTVGAQWHEEWIEPAASASTYLANAGLYPSGDSNQGRIYAGDVEPGVWLVGASGAFKPDGTGTRRVRLRRDGTADVVHSAEAVDPITGRRCAFHAATLMELDATEDNFRCEVYQDSGGNLDVPVSFQPPRVWGLWLASDDTWSTNYASARPGSSDAVADWWQDVRSNQLRTERRPSASMYRSTAQAISASTQTKVLFNVEDFDNDTNQVGTASSHISVAEAGWYLVDWGVNTVSTSGLSSTMNAYLMVNGSQVARITQAVTDTLTTALTGQVFLELAENDLVTVEVVLSSAFSVGGDRGTYLRTHMLSSASGVSTGRERFGPIPAAAEIPAIADLSSPKIALSTMRLISDLTDRMWHRPVVRLRANEVGSVATLSNDDGWVDLPVTDLLEDYTDLTGMGYSVTGGGGFRAPFAGTWLLCAYVEMSGQDEDGDNVGATGYRGCRMVQNSGGGTGSIISKSAKSSGTGWLQRWVEPFVLEEGDTVSVQGITGNMANDPGVLVTDVQLWAAEIGDGITRDAA